jgi:hypothetical protein
MQSNNFNSKEADHQVALNLSIESLNSVGKVKDGFKEDPKNKLEQIFKAEG